MNSYNINNISDKISNNINSKNVNLYYNVNTTGGGEFTLGKQKIPKNMFTSAASRKSETLPLDFNKDSSVKIKQVNLGNKSSSSLKNIYNPI